MSTASATTIITLAWPCEHGDHDGSPCDWHEMHHTDASGNHWCPTGFMFCHAHAGIGTIAPGTCTAWGTPPETEGGER